jgi:hypothetical protein
MLELNHAVSITFQLETPRDMLAKARREHSRLRDALKSQDLTHIADAIFNFAVTAYHVKDWLKASASAKYSETDVENYLQAHHQLRLCGEICNASKHKILIPPPADAMNVTTSATGTCTQATLDPNSIKLELDDAPAFRVKIVSFDGSRFEVGEFASDVLAAWEQFFSQKGLSQ